MISLIQKTDTCRAVYFDSFNKITQITNQIQDTKDMFAWFEIEDIEPFLSGKFKFSDYIVSRTDNPLIYGIVKSKVDIKRRNKAKHTHKNMFREGGPWQGGDTRNNSGNYLFSILFKSFF